MTAPGDHVALEKLALSLFPGHQTVDLLRLETMIRGVERERRRLGARRFVIVTTHQAYDFEGKSDAVRLMGSFEDRDEADRAVNFLAATRKGDLLLDPDPRGLVWRPESDDEISFLPTPRKHGSLRALHERTFKLRAGRYDTCYWCFRTVGPFCSHIVDHELFDFLNCDEELAKWFELVAAAPS